MSYNPNGYEDMAGGVYSAALGNPGALGYSSPDKPSMGEEILGLINDVTGVTGQGMLQKEQQDFQEYMYNQYNSPEALVRQFREAGVNTNLIGSTSFGTAQGAASAPSVNPAVSPINPNILQGVKNLGEGVSALSDPEVKGSQRDYNLSMVDLNKVLEEKYGSEAKLNQIQYDFVKDTYQWSLENSEFTAKSAREGYYLACQAYTKGWQEYDNLIKEGKLLDEEVERSHWEAKIKEECFNTLIEHGYMPDASYLDKVWTDYIYNGDNAGFNRFINGFTQWNDSSNRSAARFGAFGNTLKVGGIEIPVEYLLQSGADLIDIIDDIKNGTNKTRILDKIKHLFKGKKDDDGADDGTPKPNRSPSKNMSTRSAADLLAAGNMHGKSREEWIDYLIDECGYSSSWVRSHIGDIEATFIKLYK